MKTIKKVLGRTIDLPENASNNIIWMWNPRTLYIECNPKDPKQSVLFTHLIHVLADCDFIGDYKFVRHNELVLDYRQIEVIDIVRTFACMYATDWLIWGVWWKVTYLDIRGGKVVQW